MQKQYHQKLKLKDWREIGKEHGLYVAEQNLVKEKDLHISKIQEDLKKVKSTHSAVHDSVRDLTISNLKTENEKKNAKINELERELNIYKTISANPKKGWVFR